MSKYIGTFVIPGHHPQDVLLSHRKIITVDSYARRRGPLSKAASFIRACVLWHRVSRLGSRA